MILDGSHDVIDDVPLQEVEAGGVSSDETDKGEGYFVHHYGVIGQHCLIRSCDCVQ